MKVLDEALKKVQSVDIEMFLFYEYEVAVKIAEDYSDQLGAASILDKHMKKLAVKIKKCPHFTHYSKILQR